MISMISLHCKRPHRLLGTFSALRSSLLSSRFPTKFTSIISVPSAPFPSSRREYSSFFNSNGVVPKLFTKSYTSTVPTLPSSLVPETVCRASEQTTRPIVAYWLLGIGGLTFGIVTIGGITRLTESGLSITEWNLVSGMKPPITHEEWEKEFDKYKQFPEYKILNNKMTLDEFKNIFFWEWAHRMWGRMIGMAFIFPGAYFAYKGYMTKAVSRSVLGIGALIGFQGLLGWYMVKSGLSNELLETPGAVPRVSQYRLASHLGAAFLIYLTSVNTGLKILQDHKLAAGAFPRSVAAALQHSSLAPFRRSVAATAVLVFVTAISGAFVAGLDAGLVYNEFPLMGNRLSPPLAELFSPNYVRQGDSAPWRNFFENPTTVQFDHRILAITTFATIIGHWAWAQRLPLPKHARLAVNGLLAAAVAQVGLGITTLLYMVPVGLAAAHQAGSLTLLTCGLWLVHALRKVPIK